ncbi:MAG: anti-sigma F factor antagonist [Lachnospiraceae bacterium]|nr:anti-sigma F factor antagonist [Lachnospiraceae bacterium]
MKEAEFLVIGKTLVITLLQELDHHIATYIKEESDNIMNKRNIKNVIINFEHISFMDSSGIGVIIGRYKRIMYLNGKLIAVNMQPTVKRIFKMSGLHKIMYCCDTMKDAMSTVQ